jgi:hypothetical protein
MNRPNPRLSVEDRVWAAVKVLKLGAPARKPSISEVCRAAGVNRANLYANHPQIVTALKKTTVKSGKSTKTDDLRKDAQELRTQRNALQNQYKALLLLCLEQQAEIKSLQSRVASNDHLSRPCPTSPDNSSRAIVSKSRKSR